jgi:hypothetical protein
MEFWVYFEYKISIAYAWRKNGSERITITNESLIYEQINGTKTAKKEYTLSNLSELKSYEFGKNNFSDSLQSSYWVKGNESVFFSHFAEKVGMGLQLKEQEAKQLCQVLQKALRRKN